jgi:hypothetical protein
MRKKISKQNDRWCFPPAPLPGPGQDPNARGCFPDSPQPDPRDRGCFPESLLGMRPPHRPHKHQ